MAKRAPKEQASEAAEPRIRWHTEKIQAALQAVIDGKVTEERVAAALGTTDVGKVHWYVRERARRTGADLSRKRRTVPPKTATEVVANEDKKK